MKNIPRLSVDQIIRGSAETPAYDPANHQVGIVHLGPGAFHRAHQAVYTDTALAAEGGDWRITGVSLRSTDTADQLNPQNGLYTVLGRATSGTTARVIAALDKVLVGPRDGDAILEAMETPQTRIVSLTVTEKAYGINRRTYRADLDHPAVNADLMTPQTPTGVLGFITEALRRRRANGVAPFTVLSCDNLPENGKLLHSGVLDFARRIDPDLSDWIEKEVAFPSTMVDRITPASTQETYDDAHALTGCRDLAAVETEPFSQWVIEDRFTSGRPAWEAGGAIFVKDVQPYELMKLRMLNGAHSMLAYLGVMMGCTYVRDVMARPELAQLVERHIGAAQATLPKLAGVDLDEYRHELMARFANRAIAHRTGQIAMDGTEKLPQRIFSPACDALQMGSDISPFAFSVAVWMFFCASNGGSCGGLNDPRVNEITQCLQTATSPQQISDALHGLPGLFPEMLKQSSDWRQAVTSNLKDLLDTNLALTDPSTA
ncbi:MAG: mannitol dehydrogenase family protein [Paracoccaceae bacterium]